MTKIVQGADAPHTPLQNPPRIEEQVKHIPDDLRRGYAGLIVGLDDGVGTVLKALKDSGQERDTLIFFFSDNGGPVSVTHSCNTPLRGTTDDLEAGFRTPPHSTGIRCFWWWLNGNVAGQAISFHLQLWLGRARD